MLRNKFKEIKPIQRVLQSYFKIHTRSLKIYVRELNQDQKQSGGTKRN